MTKTELVEKLQKAGFREVQCQEDGSVTTGASTYWQPVKIGDEVRGFYMRDHESKFGPSPVLVTQGKDEVVLPADTVLLKFFGLIPKGCDVTVRFMGRNRTKAGQSVKTYRFNVNALPKES
jgi:hypothetical protein